MRSSEISVPADWAGEHLRIRARTLAGDPETPAPPSSTAPPGSSHETTTPGEVWLDLYQRRDNNVEKADTALLLIAPFLLQGKLAPARRLYVVSHADTHSFVYDVMEACWAAFGADGTFDRDFDRPFLPSTPEERRAAADANEIATEDTDDAGENPMSLLSSDKMYLIDDKYGDLWVQDQMALGYCSAPGGRAFNVAVNCKRQEDLYNFVVEEMPDADDRVFVFNGLSGEDQNPYDCGGNIAVSPPVPEETDEQEVGPAGPRVPEHPPAPHGKIILGDCYNPYRAADASDDGDGLVTSETRTFLESQEVQPIVPIDTSWLDVGHVDEILTFVPTPNAQNDSPAKLAMACPDIMDRLLDRTRQFSVEEGRTHFHRGRYKTHSIEDNLVENYDETRIEDFYKAEGIRDTSGRVHRECLDPIEQRLCHCIGLDRTDDVLPLPVYFTYVNPHTPRPWGLSLATPRTPNLVNMQVLQTGPAETHLLMPRPCGPRLPPEKARGVVDEVLTDLGWEDPTVRSPRAEANRDGFPFWAWPGLSADTLALFFTREKRTGHGRRRPITAADRTHIITCIQEDKSSQTLPDPLPQAVADTRESILDANPEATSRLDENARKFEDWYRLVIPEDTVDVLELYTKAVLEEMGCQVHFVDAWLYHTAGGGLHCGTNVLHEPPPDRAWWTDYSDLADADTTYLPNQTIHNPAN